MPRKRSKPSERIDSATLVSLQADLGQYSDEELAVGRHLFTDELARRAGFIDGDRVRENEARMHALLALDEADLTCREQTGLGLQTTTDYLRFKTADDPSISVFYKHFDSWAAAMAESGLAMCRQPEALLTQRQGRTPGSSAWTREECQQALALCFERYRGRRFSGGMYRWFREQSAKRLPNKEKLMGMFGKGQLAWDAALDAGIEWVKQHPNTYPKAYAYLVRAERLRGSAAKDAD